MTLRELTEEWLKEHGFDGLCNPDLECGCKLGDLMPCTDPWPEECEPGYVGPPPDDWADECDWFVYRTCQAREDAVRKAKEKL